LTWKPFASQAGGSKIAVGADGSVFVWGTNYSTDNGATWKACAGLSGTPRIASDRVNPKKFYAFANGTLYASSDGAATFTAATTGLSGSGRAAAVFGMEGEVWVAAGSNLYHSKTSGAGATKVTGPSQVYSVGFGKAATGSTYPAVYIIGTVASVSGVFRSTDQGATWLRVNDDQHQYGQMDNVAGDEDYFGRVFVTTQGRGIPYGQPGTPTGGTGGSTGGTTGATGGTTGSAGGSTGAVGGTTGSAGGSGGSRAGTTASGAGGSARGGTTAVPGGATVGAGGLAIGGIMGGGITAAAGGAGGTTVAGGGSTGAGGEIAGTTTAAGGSMGGGGDIATGGSTTEIVGGDTGGSSTSAGGATAATVASTPSSGSAGCSCSTVYRRNGSPWAPLWLALLALAALRPRKRS
jgi:hypothetical protein